MSSTVAVGTQLGPFEITGQLGVGAAGTVFRACRTDNGEQVALKTLTTATVVDEEVHRRFVREIAIAQKLDHPNIVRYNDCGVEDDILYYTMELVPWGALDQLLASRRTLPWQQAVECGVQICRGLGHLHDAGIIHRDLKPANIFLSDDGRLKLGDFGLARDLDAFRLTVDGQTVGTSKYLAPEQAMGQADLDGRTDLYALGCILFEMIAGRPPFIADNPSVDYAFQLMQKHVEQIPPRLDAFAAGVPAALTELVDELLSKEPAARPSSADELMRQLEAILNDTSHHDGRGEPGRDPGRVAPHGRSLTERLRDPQVAADKVNVRAALIAAALAVLAVLVVVAAL